MSLFDPNVKVDLAPVAIEFLNDWLDWVERGAPSGQPYWRHVGLCGCARTFDLDGDISFQLGAGRALEDAFGGQSYPFGLEDYCHRGKSGTQTECPKRLAWVRLQTGRPAK